MASRDRARLFPFKNTLAIVSLLATTVFGTFALDKVMAQSNVNSFGSTSSYGASRGFTSYTFRNPTAGNSPTFPNPSSPLVYTTVRGGVGAFANQINNTPNTSIPSYAGLNGVTGNPTSLNSVSTLNNPTGASSTTGTSLPNATLNLTPTSTQTLPTLTTTSITNPTVNNVGAATNSTAGLISNPSATSGS